MEKRTRYCELCYFTKIIKLFYHYTIMKRSTLLIIAIIMIICAVYSCCGAITEGLDAIKMNHNIRKNKSKVINDENWEDNSRVVTTESESRNVSPKINIANSKPGAVFFPGATYYVFSNVVKEKVSDTYKYPDAYDLPLDGLGDKFERRERELEERRHRWHRNRYRRRRRYNRHYRRGRGCGWRCRERRMPWHRRHMGGDTDSHGCSTDAGETWCESLGKCIQNFKPGDCPVGPGSGGGGIYHGGGTIAGGGGIRYLSWWRYNSWRRRRRYLSRTHTWWWRCRRVSRSAWQWRRRYLSWRRSNSWWGWRRYLSRTHTWWRRRRNLSWRFIR